MKVKPLHDRVLLKRIESKEQKRGGIIIPDSAKEKPMEGKVIAVGSGRLEKDGKRSPIQEERPAETAALRHEIVSDLFVELSYYESRDNHPPAGAASAAARGVIVSLGWTK